MPLMLAPIDLAGVLIHRTIHEIDADISQSQQRLSVLARYHPLRSISASRLAFQLGERYELSNQKDDLDNSILYLTESLLFSPLSWLAHGTMILEGFYCLAFSLSERSRVSGEPEDVICAAKYLRYLRGPAHSPSMYNLRQSDTELLVETLDCR